MNVMLKFLNAVINFLSTLIKQVYSQPLKIFHRIFLQNLSMLKGLMVDSYMYSRQTYCVHRRSYMSAHILLNLLNEQGGK